MTVSFIYLFSASGNEPDSSLVSHMYSNKICTTRCNRLWTERTHAHVTRCSVCVTILHVLKAYQAGMANHGQDEERICMHGLYPFDFPQRTPGSPAPKYSHVHTWAQRQMSRNYQHPGYCRGSAVDSQWSSRQVQLNMAGYCERARTNSE